MSDSTATAGAMGISTMDAEGGFVNKAAMFEDDDDMGYEKLPHKSGLLRYILRSSQYFRLLAQLSQRQPCLYDRTG